MKTTISSSFINMPGCPEPNRIQIYAPKFKVRNLNKRQNVLHDGIPWNQNESNVDTCIYFNFKKIAKNV